MSACSIIRAGQPAYPGPVRRLILVLAVLGVLGLVVYRQRTIDHWEQVLGVGSEPQG
jgi:hypothetical protein